MRRLHRVNGWPSFSGRVLAAVTITSMSSPLAGRAAEVMVGVDELGGHERADVGAVRVHELKHHGMPAPVSALHARP